MGKTLDEVVQIAEYANQNIASIGVAFSPCQLPDTKTPVFTIGEDEMEIGIGIHGETGVRRSKLMKSRDIAEYMAEKIVKDQSLEAGSRVAVMVNGLGATSQEELFILYRDVKEYLDTRGVEIQIRYIGNYATSLGMNGASLTVMRLNETLSALLAYESFSPLVRFH
jgi:dihydroxyacetone kinase-like protein